jgi:hypothetical protein
MLIENLALSASDKRLLTDGIEELVWEYVLKPSTIAVPEYRDASREYLEIAVLSLALRPQAKETRIIELVHRAIPYPVLMADALGDRLRLSLAHKRWSLGDKEATVLDGDVVEVSLDAGIEDPVTGSFLEAMAVVLQPRTSMRALYQGWMDTVFAFKAARITGTFVAASSREYSDARMEALNECQRLEAELTRLRKAAGKENQLARQVELNLEIKRLKAALQTAKEAL